MAAGCFASLPNGVACALEYLLPGRGGAVRWRARAVQWVLMALPELWQFRFAIEMILDHFGLPPLLNVMGMGSNLNTSELALKVLNH